jgi:hypothetical protein
MKVDTTKLLATYLVTLVLLVAGFLALVWSPFELDDLVKGAIISWVTLALNSIYADNASTRTARQQQSAYNTGVQTPTPE